MVVLHSLRAACFSKLWTQSSRAFSLWDLLEWSNEENEKTQTPLQ